MQIASYTIFFYFPDKYYVSIVIIKKFDFEIYTYLNILRSPKLIFGAFAFMYACT